MAKLKIGDVVEIQTKKGLVYAHYTHKHAQFGALLSIFRQFHEVRPVDFSNILSGTPAFRTFFPLSAALNRHIVSIAGNVAVAPEAQAFPIFRTGVVDPAKGKVKSWWLWDGEKEWKVGNELTAEQRKLSIRGVLNDTLLIERIESGWTPETDRT